MPSDAIRALRGALRNAALWGVTWGTAGLVLWTGLRVMGLLPPEAGLRAAAFLATRLAIAGGVAALAFSAVVRLRIVAAGSGDQLGKAACSPGW
jgi:hypothetical protein